MMLQAMSDPLRPWIVNSEIGDMRESLMNDSRLLDFQRIDVRLDPVRGEGAERAAHVYAEDVLGRPLTDKQLLELDALANGRPENMEMLLDLGRRTGPLYVSRDYPNPYFDLPQWTKVA
jgi:hypothetical protein